MNYAPSDRARAATAAECWRFLVWWMSWLLMVVGARAATEGAKSFNIPAGEAAATLKQFSAQAGEQLLYSMEAVKGVTSHAIKGQMSPREALSQMFTGTALTIVQDRSNGALSLVRAPDSNNPRA